MFSVTSLSIFKKVILNYCSYNSQICFLGIVNGDLVYSFDCAMFPCSFLDCDFCEIGYGEKTVPSSVFMGWEHIFQSFWTGQGNTVISQFGQIFWGCLRSFLGTLLWASVYNFQVKGACCFFSGDCNVLLHLVSVCGITVSLVLPLVFSNPNLVSKLPFQSMLWAKWGRNQSPRQDPEKSDRWMYSLFCFPLFHSWGRS